MSTNAPYLNEVHAALPRVLALFDTNPISATRGMGDRYRWAWKGTDFANGTFQGAVHGLALLTANNVLPDRISDASIVARINAAIEGIRAITRPNGSLDEILPYESSYCVTALVVFDALCAIDALGARLSEQQRKQHFATLVPLVRFLERSKESHGIITNHLAVAVAALARWQTLTGEHTQDARDTIMKVILTHRSEEGWFKEYDGADPGYQTLALDYLVDLYMPELNLAKTCEFLSYCMHPDGSFGGLYGSRNTRFLYPAGIETLAQTSPHAAALAQFARKAHTEKTAVGLAAMDDSNLIPMFNSFCRAAILAKQPHTTPHVVEAQFQKHFEQAGLIVTKNAQSYSVVNWHKGVVSHFGAQTVMDGGALAKDGKGRYFTSQTAGNAAKLIACNASQIIIELPLQRYHVSHPTALQMVVLRLLCVSVMRIPALNAIVKKLLVWLLISRKAKSSSIVRRTITLQPEFTIKDEWMNNSANLLLQKAPSAFQAVHMASQGYWQLGDDA